MAPDVDLVCTVRAWVLRFGPGDLWRIAGVLSGGVLLATRTAPFPLLS
ncbi:MAG: hypothetical protein ACLP50_23485 [Solirubrobacteraceae bacterium]